MKNQLLVIDDSPKVHSLVKAILSKEPIDIHSATDPMYGLTLAASVHPDLIFLDVDMPEMNGFEACKRLKADPATAQCPIIFLTAHATYTEKVQGFELGAVDYVTKPFNPGELLVRVRNSLATHGTIRCRPTALFANLKRNLSSTRSRGWAIRRCSTVDWTPNSICVIDCSTALR